MNLEDKEPPRVCQHCGEEIEDFGHLVEAFETVGKIVCESCWAYYCEENQV